MKMQSATPKTLQEDTFVQAMHLSNILKAEVPVMSLMTQNKSNDVTRKQIQFFFQGSQSITSCFIF